MPKLSTLAPIRPVIAGALQQAVERFAVAHSLDTTAATRFLLTEALTASKFLQKDKGVKK